MKILLIFFIKFDICIKIIISISFNIYQRRHLNHWNNPYYRKQDQDLLCQLYRRKQNHHRRDDLYRWLHQPIFNQVINILFIIIFNTNHIFNKKKNKIFTLNSNSTSQFWAVSGALLHNHPCCEFWFWVKRTNLLTSTTVEPPKSHHLFNL